MPAASSLEHWAVSRIRPCQGGLLFSSSAIELYSRAVYFVIVGLVYHQHTAPNSALYPIP